MYYLVSKVLAIFILLAVIGLPVYTIDNVHISRTV